MAAAMPQDSPSLSARAGEGVSPAVGGADAGEGATPGRRVEELKDRIKQATDEGRFDDIPSLLQQIQALTYATDVEGGRPLGSKGRCESSASTRTPVSWIDRPPSQLSQLSSPEPELLTPQLPTAASTQRRRPHTARDRAAAQQPSRSAAPYSSLPEESEDEAAEPSPAHAGSQSLPKRPTTAPSRSARPRPSSARVGYLGMAPVTAPVHQPIHLGAAPRPRPAAAQPSPALRPAVADYRAESGAAAAEGVRQAPDSGSRGGSGRQPPFAAQLPSPPHGHAEGPRGRLRRVLPPGQVNPRQAKIFSEAGGLSSSPWRAEEWLLMRQRALQNERADELVPLLEAVRASTEKAIEDGAYEVLAAPGHHAESVDLSAIASANPYITWRRRESLSMRAPPPQLGKQTPRMQIDSESVLDTAIRLRQAGVKAPIVVVAEVQAFTGDGSIDTRSAQAVTPGDLLLRSDFARFAGDLHKQCSLHRDGLPGRLPARSRADAALGALCNTRALASTLGAPPRGVPASLRGELAAHRNPSVVTCNQVTIFRGSAEDGYPFLKEPVQVTVLVTAFPCLDPHIRTMWSQAHGSYTEWYSLSDERDTVIERLELLAELARRESSVDEHAGGAPPLLLLCPPGCGAPRQQPRHALAYMLKAWRLRFGGCFGRVHLCCRDSRAPLEKLADFMNSTINEEPARCPLLAAAWCVEPDDLQAAAADVRRELPTGDVAAGIDAIIAMQQLSKEARYKARAEKVTSERRMSDPGNTTRVVERRMSQQVLHAATCEMAGLEYRPRRQHKSCSYLDDRPESAGSPAVKRRKSCEIHERRSTRSYSDWMDETEVSKVATMRKLGRQKIQMRAEVFRTLTHKSDARMKQTLNQVRRRSCVQAALGDHSSADKKVIFSDGQPQRRGSDAIGTKRDDPRGIFGACLAKDYKPVGWGFKDDKRQLEYESGRTGEYEVLRDQWRRRLSRSKAAPAGADPGLPGATPSTLGVVQAGVDLLLGPSEAPKAKVIPHQSAMGSSEAMQALLWTASSEQVSRQVMRQHARIEAMKYKFDNEVEDHCAADRDAVQLEGALLVVAAGVGDKLETGRQGRQIARKW